MDTKKMPETTASLPGPQHANRLARYEQNELEVSFSAEPEMACCGEVLRPFWADDGRFISVCGRCGRKYTDRAQVRYKASPWIGVDLDGTLAHDPGSRSKNKGMEEIGSPIWPMVRRLRKWVADGKTVKIFTARASSLRQVAMIKQWLASHGLPDLEVTNVKDMRMVELWDDRCVQVMTNLGEPIGNESSSGGERQVATPRPGGRPHAFSLLSRLKIFLTL
jgi:hypothetical protein